MKSIEQSVAFPSISQIKDRAALPLQSWIEIILIEPIALRLVWLILRVAPGTTPNLVTAGSLVCAVAAAGFFLLGDYLLAAVILQLHTVLDNADGILARATGRTSRLGGALDGLVNSTAYALNLGALFLSLGDDWMTRVVGVTLFVVWALHMEIGGHLDRPERSVWASIVPDERSWLRRNRLLYPLSFPDRHFILFVIGPLSGFALFCGCAVLLVEAASLLVKFRRLLRSLGNGR